MFNNKDRYLFIFAWKSILRNPGRSFFIGFSVSLAVVIAIWVVAFFDGLNGQIEKAVVDTNTGYFQVQEQNYANSTDSSLPREYSREIAEKINRYPVSAASPELVLDANIATPEGAAGLQVIGIDPKLHQHLIPLSEKIISGRFINDRDQFSVVIGKELAHIFKLQIGDQLVLNYQDQSGELRSELLNVQGIYNYNGKGFAKRFVYINQSTWQQLFLNQDTGKILFNRITLLTPGLRVAPDLKERLVGSDLELKSWKDINPEMAVVLEFHDGMIKFFFIIIVITITMTIITPVQMLWQERLRELKMMSVIGVARSKFWKIGIYEVLIMILLSSGLSSLLLASIIGWQSIHGVDFRSLNDGISIERAGIKLPGVIYPQTSTEQLLITFLFVMIVLGFSYIWSIYRTLRKLEAES